MQPYSQHLSTKSSLRQAEDGVRRLDEAIPKTQNLLLALQHPEGFWWGELESNVTITAEAVFLYKILGLHDEHYPATKVENYIRGQQCASGGWEVSHGDGGELSASTEAYVALHLLGVPKTDAAMLRAKDFIVSKGGISKTRVLTKMCLAILGCYSWRGIPSIPPWLMLLPNWLHFNIYETSSWARSSIVPLIIVFDRKPIFSVIPHLTFNELCADRKKDGGLLTGPWTEKIFVGLDRMFKLMERINIVPLRERGIREAEKWVLERQEESGDWSGIFPAMCYSILALHLLGYAPTHPVIQRGLQALRGFSIEMENEFWLQACVSPVWDTALIVRALVDSGLSPDHPALQRAGEWLLRQQIIKPGDWAIKNKAGCVGAWSFEFVNRWYPDVDDTAMVVMALEALQLPVWREPIKHGAIKTAVNWIMSMQCKGGGWAAFDKDNEQQWLNATPFGDLKAMVDPNTSDVTARVLEMAARMRVREGSDTGCPMTAVKKGVEYLRKEQEQEGCWFGRWGVNYIYGTSEALVALALLHDSTNFSLGYEIKRGAEWLGRAQRKQDGGWGETCSSYDDKSLKGKADASTPSQTAWAVIGLLAAGDALGTYEVQAIEGGISYLLKTQRADGSWHEALFTGTGFPGNLYLKYHFYALHFSLSALSRFRQRATAMRSAASS